MRCEPEPRPNALLHKQWQELPWRYNSIGANWFRRIGGWSGWAKPLAARRQG